MKKKLTVEQEAARDARREALKAHIKTIAAMPDDQRAELAARLGVVVTCEGHPLSPKNCMLLALQLPGGASIVGGFRQWIKAGRCVRKGEHGAGIYFPKAGKKDEADKAAEAEGLTKMNDEIRFLVGTVFDISQTDELADKTAESEAA